MRAVNEDAGPATGSWHGATDYTSDPAGTQLRSRNCGTRVSLVRRATPTQLPAYVAEASPDHQASKLAPAARVRADPTEIHATPRVRG